MPSPRQLFVAAAVATAAFISTTAAAQAPAPTVTRSARAQVIDTLTAYLERAYVYADTGHMIAQVLRSELRRGAYDSLSYAPRFAEAVTTDMRRVNNDVHLLLQWDPRGATEAGPLPSNGISFGAPRAAAAQGAAPASGATVITPLMRNAMRRNYGIERVEILPGNIAYVQINNFLGAPGYEEAVGNVVRMIANADAIIFDLRRNGGGSGNMSHYLFSHFFPESGIETIHFTNRSSGQDEVLHTTRALIGPRLTDVPLYVLTSGRTASAGEEFSTVLKTTGRATVIGSSTAGAGHMVTMLDVGSGFAAGVSITKVQDARTGQEWERVGVQPNVVVDPETALDIAQVKALTQLANRESDADRRRTLERRAETIAAAAAHPATPSGADAFAGRYEGGARVEFRQGALWISSRDGALADAMVPLGHDRYALGAQRFAFTRNARGVVMTVEQADSTVLSYQRLP